MVGVLMKHNKDVYDFIYKIYENDKCVLSFLLPHVESVAELAVRLAEKHGADVDFVCRASLLHDIGVFMTNATKIGCRGISPYMQHGVFGKILLESYGFTREATVALTHVGAGITAKHIIENSLPLPPIDMVPKTLEEEIVSYVDLFFSKRPDKLTVPKTVEEVSSDVKRYGDDSYKVFEKWHRKFGDLQ